MLQIHRRSRSVYELEGSRREAAMAASRKLAAAKLTTVLLHGLRKRE